MKGKPPKKPPYWYYRKEFQKKKVNPKLAESLLYEQSGSITIATEMFMMGNIIYDHSAQEAARQASSWVIENGKPSTDDCAYNIGLLMIISELKRTKVLIKPLKKRDYHTIRTEAVPFRI
jgi:hypothetical protein